ncbi:MAG: hypothetical protein BMS9Abin33_0632 [Gammaproteobacteria bacterium]|nr:MAG: hypothetical protein BMS9Abin33_0632 [Gammaproteobacteria bacterium]
MLDHTLTMKKYIITSDYLARKKRQEKGRSWPDYALGGRNNEKAKSGISAVSESMAKLEALKPIPMLDIVGKTINERFMQCAAPHSLQLHWCS